MAQNKGSSSNKRTEVKAQQQAAAARSRRNRLIGAISAVVVVAVVLIVIVIWQQKPGGETTNPTPTPTVQATSSDTAQSSGAATSATPSSAPAMLIPPDGTDEAGWIEVRNPDAAADVPVVDEHVDYQCPNCEVVDSLYGSPMRELAERGDIVLHVHIRSFLDGNLRNDSSTRAAVAATCADVAGGSSAFIDYHEAIFANQPADEGTGYTDQQLRVDFPAQAGITGNTLTAFQACYDARDTLAYVQRMEQVNTSSTTINGADQKPPRGTPAMYVNGKQIDLSDLVGVSGNKYVPAIDNSPDGLLAYLKSVG